MVYLLCGEDSGAKDRKITEIKKKYISSNEALEFDYEAFYGQKLDPAELKKSLIALPAVAKQRLILIRSVHKLNPQNKEIIFQFIQKKEKLSVLILDSEKIDAKDSFTKKITPFVQLLRFSTESQKNVFDMTRAMSSGKGEQALKILEGLISSGTHPLQLMGGLVWFWGKSRNRLSEERYRNGLLALEEADLNIKRSRLNPIHALEILVVKLMNI